MVMMSLPRIFDDAPVAYLTPPSWCTEEGAVLVDPGGDRSGVAYGEYNLTEPTPLQVDHVAVEFIVERSRPSGPFLRTMNISAR